MCRKYSGGGARSEDPCGGLQPSASDLQICPIPASVNRPVQESCGHQRCARARFVPCKALTWLFFVPGAGFEPARSFERGGLRRHKFHPAGPAESVCPAHVHGSCPSRPSDPPSSARCGRVLCRNRAGICAALSYHLSYHGVMTGRQKRSISLPPELADAIDAAAEAEGTTVSAGIAETAAHRLPLDAGRQGIAEWERTHGNLTPEELAQGLARARSHPAPHPSRQERMMNGITYDAGALIAADLNDRRMWALHAGFLALETSPTVPTPVLAEAWRGGPPPSQPGPFPRPVHHRAVDRRTSKGRRHARSTRRPRRHRRRHRRRRSRPAPRRRSDLQPHPHPQNRRPHGHDSPSRPSEGWACTFWCSRIAGDLMQNSGRFTKVHDSIVCPSLLRPPSRLPRLQRRSQLAVQASEGSRTV